MKTYNVLLKKKVKLILLSVINSTLISIKVIIYQMVVCNLILGLANKYYEILTLDMILIVTYNIILGML